MRELKRCPFCGGKAVTKGVEIGKASIAFVECYKCGALISFKGKEPLDETVEAYNSRVQSQENA